MSRTADSLALGCLLGAGAAGLNALGDFGAHWLYLDGTADRVRFLLSLLALQAPVGAALGLATAALIALTQHPLRALAGRLAGAASGSSRELRVRDALGALRLTSLLAPLLLWIAILVFSGASISRLPLLPLWKAATFAVLTALSGVALYLAHRVARHAERARRIAVIVAVTAATVAFVLGKLDQWVLPKLYEYLHTALTATSFAFNAFALYCLWLGFADERSRRALPMAGAAAAGLLLATFNGAITHLDDSQTVRVALLEARASHSRSLMQGLAPFLLEDRDRAAVEHARQQAREARSQRERGLAGPNSGPTAAEAHILLITVDALRADHLGLYGYSRDTSPELDRLAQTAVVFERAYAPAPHSSYSLCSLMTSEYLHETTDLGLPLPEATLPLVLAQAGYHSAAFYTDGIFHTAGQRLRPYEDKNFGFALADHQDRPPEQMTDRALEEIDRTIARGEPSSLLWVHYFNVHEPYRATHFGDSDLDRYDSEIRLADTAIARLIREARSRLSRPVVVAITADHGEEFREHGGVYHGSTLYEEQVRVPLLIDAPGLPPARVAAPVETVDLAPTLLALVDVARPPSMRGDDLRPLARGQLKDVGPAFSAVIHKKMVVRWPHKLIADLRFGLFELYDLESDSGERTNLADARPELLASLKGEVHAWLDTLNPAEGPTQKDPMRLALDWGHLRDRRAVRPLSELVANEAAPSDARCEAARILGDLTDPKAATALLHAMASADRRVAAEAAIALGRMYDARARKALQQLVLTEDPDVRTRAAVSLGRLRDQAAVPGLIDALWMAEDRYEREEAVRWLGRLRDPRALTPLIELLPETRTRYLVVVAMGLIGDRRAYDPLVDVLGWERHPNIRDNAVRGLGLLGDRRAIDVIVPLAVAEPSLKNPSESLVRLGAIGAGAIGGVDVDKGTQGLSGFAQCVRNNPLHDWDYLHRTHCITRGAQARLRLSVPPAVSAAPGGVTLAIAMKRADTPAGVPVTLEVGGDKLEAGMVDGSWTEFRFAIAPGRLRKGRINARLVSADPSAKLAVDHVLLLPRGEEAFAQRVE